MGIRMMKANKERARRNYSKEFKLEAVRLATESGRSQSEVAQSPGT